MNWKQGLKQEFDRLEAKMIDLFDRGFTEDSPEVKWLWEELNHFEQMADKMVEETKKYDRFRG